MTAPGQDKLDSWKEIAKYLDCDKRTAMRYAKDRGMPVQRVPGGKMGRVSASREEIRKWLEQGKVEQGSIQEQAEEKPGRSALRKKWVWGIGAVAVVLGLVAFSRLSRGVALPTEVKFTADAAHAISADGRELWTYPLPKRLDRTGMPDAIEQYVRIGDFRGDGKKEVLMVLSYREGPNKDDGTATELKCFASDGKLLWTYVPAAKMRFGEHELAGTWVIRDLFVSERAPKPLIWVAAVHAVRGGMPLWRNWMRRQERRRFDL